MPESLDNSSAIKAKDVFKSYGKGQNEFKALRGVSLDIKQGESVAIIGKSGSGKSTLMHLLALLDKPSNGSIYIKDKDSGSLSGKYIRNLRNKQFGFVFQQFFLNANSSVLDNVILPLKIAKIGNDERKRLGMYVLKQVGLEDKAKNKAKDLSGGQMQRVVIARALINSPQVIFADEPTGNLDSATGSVVENLLFNLNKMKNITLVIVTHDIELAKRCDRFVLIKDGQIIKQGFTHPQQKARL